MAFSPDNFELPRKLEKITASLSQYYARQGNTTLQSIIVNSPYHVEEGRDYDNLDGGQYGHAVYFQVPGELYYRIVDGMEEVAQQLSRDINRLSNVDREFISAVFLELQDEALINWRERSGVLISDTPLAQVSSEEDVSRLWSPDYLRVFLSHISDYRQETAELKEALAEHGITSFVAHMDIEPTREWLDEIEKALFSMEVMIPLLTPGFPSSKWTDHEVGLAIGRGVPVIPVKLGIDPYGLIGKYQAVNGIGKQPIWLAETLFGVLFSSFPAIRERLAEGLIARFERARSFNDAERLMDHLWKLQTLPPALIERLEKAPERNHQVGEAFGVQSRLPKLLQRLRGA